MATRGAGQPKAKTGKGTSRSGRGTHSDDSPSKPSDKGSYRCFFCIANPSLYQSKDLECCTGRGFSTLALLLQHITKKHGHCPDCYEEFKAEKQGSNEGNTITSVIAWAELQSSHVCQNNGGLAPQGGQNSTTGQKVLPEALAGDARKMWRKLGTDGPQNFKQSAEWRDAEERVNRARKKKESRDDKRWVVWFAILFPDMDILDNVNPRANYWVPAYIARDDWCLVPTTETAPSDFVSMEVPLEGTTSNYEALNENFMGDIRNAGYDERWMPNDCHGRPLEVNMDDFRRNMAAAENDDSGYGTYEQYVSNTGEPSGFGRSSSPIHGRSLKPDMDDFEPNMEEVENEGLGYGTYAQYMSNAGEPSDFEQPSSPTSWTSGGSHGQG